MIGDNYCTSCLRVIPPHQFFRTWCDECVEALKNKIENEDRLRGAREQAKKGRR